ncbi:MAG TPA: DNA primase small subunit domain-containing protein, partial [bacterium]|nr:DNA primase small subunit domain-containing protein [bacterium]
TKGDLIEYYLRLGPVMLPHLRARPVTLRRFPNGISGESFYQKDVPDAPPFVRTIEIWSEGSRSTIAAPLCDNLETLLWLAQLADIEIHTWFSRVTPPARGEQVPPAGTDFASSPEALRASVLNRPDYIAFDIDPYLFPDHTLPARRGEKDPDYSRRGFEAAREAAFLVRDLLTSLKLESFVKTSGKTGLHLFVPVARNYTFEQTHEFAKTVTQYLEGRYPRKLTTAWSAEHRVGKVFLDYNQNRLGATLAAPYSVRPTPQATVAMPVTWRELEAGLDPLQFTLRSVPELMRRRPDPWRHLLARPQRLERHL